MIPGNWFENFDPSFEKNFKIWEDFVWVLVCFNYVLVETRGGMENLGDERGSLAEPSCIVDGKIVVEDVGV